MDDLFCDRYAQNRWHYLVVSLDSTVPNDTYFLELRYVTAQGHLHRTIGQIGPHVHKKQTTFVQPLFIPYFPHDQYQFVTVPPHEAIPPPFGGDGIMSSSHAAVNQPSHSQSLDTKDREKDKKIFAYESPIFTLDELFPFSSEYLKMRSVGKQLLNTIGRGHIYVNIFTSTYSPLSSLSCFTFKLGYKLNQSETLASKLKKFSLSTRKKNPNAIPEHDQQKYRLVIYATSDYYTTRSSIGQISQNTDTEDIFEDYMLNFVIGSRFDRGVLLFVSDNYIPTPFPTSQYSSHPSMHVPHQQGGAMGLPSLVSATPSTATLPGQVGYNQQHHHPHGGIAGSATPSNSNKGLSASNYSFSFSNPHAHASSNASFLLAGGAASAAGVPTSQANHIASHISDVHHLDETISSSSSSITAISSHNCAVPPHPSLQHQPNLPNLSYHPHGGYTFSFDSQLLKWLIPSENQVIRHMHRSPSPNEHGKQSSTNQKTTVTKEYLYATNEKFILQDRELSQILLVFEIYDEDKLICTAEESLYHLINPFIARNKELYPLMMLKQQEIEQRLENNPRLIACGDAHSGGNNGIHGGDLRNPPSRHLASTNNQGILSSPSSAGVTGNSSTSHHPLSKTPRSTSLHHDNTSNQNHTDNSTSFPSIIVPKALNFDDAHDDHHHHTHTPRHLVSTHGHENGHGGTTDSNRPPAIPQGLKTPNQPNQSLVTASFSGTMPFQALPGSDRPVSGFDDIQTADVDYPHTADDNDMAFGEFQNEPLFPPPHIGNLDLTNDDDDDDDEYENEDSVVHMNNNHELTFETHPSLYDDIKPSSSSNRHFYNDGGHPNQPNQHDKQRYDSLSPIPSQGYPHGHTTSHNGTGLSLVIDDDSNSHSNSTSRHFRYDLTNLPLSPSSTASTSHRYSSHNLFGQRNSTSGLSVDPSLSPTSMSVSCMRINTSRSTTTNPNTTSGGGGGSEHSSERTTMTYTASTNTVLPLGATSEQLTLPTVFDDLAVSPVNSMTQLNAARLTHFDSTRPREPSTSHQREVQHLLLSRRKSIAGPLHVPLLDPIAQHDTMSVGSSSTSASVISLEHQSSGSGRGKPVPSSPSNAGSLPRNSTMMSGKTGAKSIPSPTFSLRSLQSAATAGSRVTTSPVSSANANQTPYNYGSILPTCFITGGSDNLYVVRPSMGNNTHPATTTAGGVDNTPPYMARALHTGNGNGAGDDGSLRYAQQSAIQPISGSLTPRARPTQIGAAGPGSLESNEYNPASSPLTKSHSRVTLTRSSSSHSTRGQKQTGLSLSYSIEDTTPMTSSIALAEPTGLVLPDPLLSTPLRRVPSGSSTHDRSLTTQHHSGGVDTSTTMGAGQSFPPGGDAALANGGGGVLEPAYATLQLPIYAATKASRLGTGSHAPKTCKGTIFIHAVTHHHLPSFDEMIRQNNIVFRPLVVVDGYLHPSQFQPIQEEIQVDHKGVIISPLPFSPTNANGGGLPSSSLHTTNSNANTRQSMMNPFQQSLHNQLLPHPSPPRDPYILSIGKCKQSLIRSVQYLFLLLSKFTQYCSYRKTPTSMHDVNRFFHNYYSAISRPFMKNPDLELPQDISHYLSKHIGDPTPYYTIESAGIPVIAANVYPPPHRVATRQLNTTREYINKYSEDLHHRLMAKNNHNINYSIYEFNALVTGHLHPVPPSTSKCPGISRVGVIPGDTDYQYQLREAQLVPAALSQLGGLDVYGGQGHAGSGAGCGDYSPIDEIDHAMTSMYFVDDYLCQVYDTRQLRASSSPTSSSQAQSSLDYPTSLHQLQHHISTMLKELSSYPTTFNQVSSPLNSQQQPPAYTASSSTSPVLSPRHVTPAAPIPGSQPLPAAASLSNLPLLIPPNKLSLTLDDDHTYLEETIIYIARMIVYRTLYDYNKKISEQIAVSRLNENMKGKGDGHESSFHAHQKSSTSRGVVEYYVAFITGTDFDGLFPEIPEYPSSYQSKTTPNMSTGHRQLSELTLTKSLSGSSSLSASSSSSSFFPSSVDGISLSIPGDAHHHGATSGSGTGGQGNRASPKLGTKTPGLSALHAITPQALYQHIDPMELARKRQEHVTKIIDIIQYYTASLPISFVFLGNNEHDGLSLMDVDYHHYCYGINSMLLSTSQQQQHYPHLRSTTAYSKTESEKCKLFQQYTFDEVIDHVLYCNHPSQSTNPTSSTTTGGGGGATTAAATPMSSSTFHSKQPSSSPSPSIYHHANNKYDVTSYNTEFLFRPRHNTIYIPCASLFSEEILESIFSVDFTPPKHRGNVPGQPPQSPPPPPPPAHLRSPKHINLPTDGVFSSSSLSPRSAVSLTPTHLKQTQSNGAPLSPGSPPPPPPPPVAVKQLSVESTQSTPQTRSGAPPPPPPPSHIIPSSTTTTAPPPPPPPTIHLADPLTVINNPQHHHQAQQLNLLVTRLKHRLAIQVKRYIDLHFRHYTEQQQLALYHDYTTPQHMNPFTLLLNNQGYHHAINCSFIQQVERGAHLQGEIPPVRRDAPHFCLVNDLGLCRPDPQAITAAGEADIQRSTESNTSRAITPCGHGNDDDALLTSSAKLLFSKAQWVADHRQEYLDAYYVQE